MKPSREKTYRANSLARELRKLGGENDEFADGFENFVYHWYHTNTIVLHDHQSAIGHHAIYIGCNEREYVVAVHVIQYSSISDVFRYTFKDISGFSLLVKLVKCEILSARFAPVLDYQYSKLLNK